MLLLAVNAQQSRPAAVDNSDVFEQPKDCGTKEHNFKPCIDRKLADKVFASCCERFIPIECRLLCTYENNPIDARVLLMHAVQPNRCRLYKYLSAIVHCAAQTHDNRPCCKESGIDKFGDQCLEMCNSQTNPRRLIGTRSLRKDMVVCLSKWDQIMQCHQSGLRARKAPKTPTAVAANVKVEPVTVPANKTLA